MPTEPLAEALAALSQHLVANSSVADTLDRLTRLAQSTVEPAAYAGMTMLDDRGRAATTVFTNPDVPHIDQAQYDVGHGPCLDSWRTARVIGLDDLSEVAEEYQAFARAALEHGIHSTLSLPLVAADRSFGALNLYSPRPNSFTADHQASAQQYAKTSAAVLANASAYWEAFDVSQGLRTAMESRAIIEQAKGILMARTPGLDADGAFKMLTAASQRENVKLRDIARRIVDQRPAV